MKIFIVTPLLPPEAGGPSYYSVKLKAALEELGEEVDLMAFREVRKYPSFFRHLFFFFKVLRRARGFEQVIILDTVSVALPAVLATKILNIPVIIRIGGDFVWERYVERTGEKILLSEFYKKNPKLSKKEQFLIWLQKKIILPGAKWLVFNTAWQRSIWEIPYKLDLKKTVVIENAYQINDNCLNKKQITDKPLEKVDFIVAWRSTAFKNVDSLQKAFVMVTQKIPKANLKIYKNIPKEQLQKHMSKARAIIIPSLSEVNPNLALEAIAMGLPVILTKDCGIYNHLEDTVLWINPTDTDDIAEKIISLCNDNFYQKIKTKIKEFSFRHSYFDIAKEFLTLMK